MARSNAAKKWMNLNGVKKRVIVDSALTTAVVNANDRFFKRKPIFALL